MHQPNTHQPSPLKSVLKLYLRSLGYLSIFAVVLLSFATYAAAPAGSLVGNQGSMEFIDADGVRRTVSSNLIEIEVLQVFSITVEGGFEKPTTAGGQVTFPHRVTNTGNGSDNILLNAANAAGDSFDFTDIQIFADDGTGQPTGDPITDPVVLAAGDSFDFIVVATVPGDAQSDDRATLDITAQSSGPDGNPATDTTEDAAIISDDAIVNIGKRLSDDSGPTSGDVVTVTLDLENITATDATQVVVTDVLDEGFVYADESGVWSESGTALTDEAGNDSAGIDYQWNPATRTITATIDTLSANTTQSISFGVTIAADAPAGDVDNTATISYNDGDGGQPENGESNTVSYNVEQTGNPDADDQNPDGSSTSTTDEDGISRNDEIVVENAPQGGDVPFDVVVTNNGNGDDVFNVEVPQGTFPPGTVFTIYKADGKTPLLDTDGDGIPDTGSLAPGESANVVIVATLPDDVNGNNGGQGFDTTVTLTSGVDGTTDETTIKVINISVAAVDLTNDRSLDDGANAADGSGPGAEDSPVRSVTTDPGQAAVFTLVVNNTSDSNENYALSAETVDGIAIQYYLDDGDGIRNEGDTLITDGKTGIVGGNSSVMIFAEATPAATTEAGSYTIDFSVVSPRTGAGDTIRDEITVNAVSDIELQGSDEGTVTIGGQITYVHQLVNNGNVPAEVDLTTDDSQPGFTSEIYIDVDGDGIIGPNDTLVTGPITLAPGETIDLLVKVTAPTDAENGDQNTTTLTGTVNGEPLNTVIDTTTVSAGEAELLKEQALDADCDGTVETAYSTDRGQGAPGECISYRLTGTNTGNTTITDALISDFTPEYTVYTDCNGACPASASNGGTVSNPASGNEGGVSLSRDTLAPGESDTLTFSVQLEP